MDIYIYILIFLVVAACINKRIFNLFAVFCLFLVAAFRNFSVGTDTENYIFAFDYLNNHDTLYFVLFGWESHLELFYRALVFFIKKIGGDFRLLLIVQSILFFVLLHVFFRKNTKNEGMALLLMFVTYFYFQFFNVSRQMLAISFCSLSYFMLMKGWIKSALVSLFLISYFIHTSCFMGVFLILFDRYKKKISSQMTIGIVLASFVLPFILGNFNFLDSLLRIIGYVKFDLYFEQTNSVVYYGRLLPSLLFIFLYFVFKNVVNYEENIFYKAYFLQVVFYNLFVIMPVVGDRMMLVFELGTIVYWCSCVEYKRMKVLIPVLGVNILSFFQALFANSGGIVPYKFG